MYLQWSLFTPVVRIVNRFSLATVIQPDKLLKSASHRPTAGGSLAGGLCRRLVAVPVTARIAAQLVDHLDQRQEQGDDDAANDDGEEDDHDRLEQ